MARAKTKTKTEAVTPDLLRLEYVPLSTIVAWEKNPKKHDIGAIWQSIQRHGLKDPPKFEAKLNDGRGGIVEGNGRSHVLKQMQEAREPVPRGITESADGEWFVPVLFGVDAESERAAEAYGVDHNNLVLSGGDFSNIDIAKLWDEKAYAAMLADLAQFDALPVSVDGEDVDDLIERLASDGSANKSGQTAGGGAGANMVPSDDRYKEQYGVIVICSDESEQKETFERLQNEGYQCRVVTT